MPPDVFLSYARSASAAHVAAVHAALGRREIEAFFDTASIQPLERFTADIADALLGAKVVVIFADADYFTRWYCLWEWRVARTPFLAALERPDAPADERRAALDGLLLVLPPSGRPSALDRFPPELRDVAWPNADDAEAVADAVADRLARVRDTLADRLDRLPETRGREAVRRDTLALTQLPEPLRLAGVPRAPLSLPASIGEHFVGRANDLWRIDDLLVSRIGGTPGAAALTGAISAMGGVGKTRLALEYLHRFGPRRFPGGLFWIDADLSESLIEARHHEILEALVPDTPPIQLYRDPASGRKLARDLVRAVEARAIEKPILVVLDNLPEPPLGATEARKRLTDYWPPLGTTATLVTARFDVSIREGHAVAPLPLGLLDATSAVRMLVDGFPDRGRLTSAEWSEIADWVGRLPLVLSVLNGALRSGGLDPHDLHRHAREGGSVMAETTAAYESLPSDAREDGPRALYRHAEHALALSFELLTPEVQRAAHILAHLAPAPIPLALLDAMPEHFPPPVRSALVTRSFVTRRADGSVPSWDALHRVLAEFLQRRQDEVLPSSDIGTMLREALLSVMTPDRCRDPGAWPLMASCLPHAELALAVASTELDSMGKTAVETVVGLSVQAGFYSWSQGQFARARRHNEAAVAYATARLGAEHPDTLVCLGNLGATLRAQGELAAARAVEERVLAAQERLRGADHPDTLRSLGNLAETLRAQGDLAAARAAHARAYEVHTRLLGAEHPSTLGSLNNLAGTFRAQGDLAGARAAHERVLSARERLLGHEHPDTLTSLGNLAEVLNAQGDLAGARTAHERVLAARERILGAKHPHTLTSLNNLAETLRAQGDLAGARAAQERVLAAHERLLGREHPDTLKSRHNLAVTLAYQGAFAAAISMMERVLDARYRVLGESHPDTQRSRQSLDAMRREV